MIVKKRDATNHKVAYLETYEAPDMDSVQRQGLKQAAARLKASCTSDNACSQIDSYFADSKDWLVIHDLRIQHAHQIIQINHLLISSALDFYIVDSRYLKSGLTLNENGQCWVQNNNRNVPIASPLNKLNRDIRIMRDIIKSAKQLPRFLGISPMINVQGYILTNPSLKTHKPLSSELDTSAVIASDMLFATVWEKRQSWMRSKVNNIDSITLYKLTQALLSMHTPTTPQLVMNNNMVNAGHLQHPEQDTTHCAKCSKPVTAYVREQCFRHMGRLRGQVLCVPCQAAVQNEPKRPAVSGL